ncbi:hypothetical protein BS47DRAFT_1295577 [Hydnum rufescens UP504]|uniref:Uncharacterized protein n=1 Tax=Hydnum rufescens UP504 TaxID=1448309 RepID=A0A9P6DWP2_9AGAM|nr:hypothetical protein BS47DRAFT_1295577 [Hydnum rufescens UP504]
MAPTPSEVSPTHSSGFASPINRSVHPESVFFHEAVYVSTAFIWGSELVTTPHRLAVFTDSLNAIQIFRALHADSLCNPILFLAVEVILDAGVDLCVFHIPTSDNFVADGLSCHFYDVAVMYVSGPSVSTFIPPWDTLLDGIELHSGRSFH